MCSYLIGSLRGNAGLTTCYYFCNSTDPGNVCERILAFICLQILRFHPELCTLIANEYVYHGLVCSMSQLRQLVPKLLALVGFSRVVVDGVDECTRDDQKIILKDLIETCTAQDLHCKVLLSSRKESYVRKKLQAKPSILLDERQEVKWDITTFVKHKMAKVRTSNQDLRERLEHILVTKSNGKSNLTLLNCATDATLLMNVAVRYVFVGQTGY